jgi:hypothetical protein
MDFITGLPKVHGRDCIYVVVDRLTKFTHFFSIPSEYKANIGSRVVLQGGIQTPWVVEVHCQ